MNILERLYDKVIGRRVFGRRVEVLCGHLVGLLPQIKGARVALHTGVDEPIEGSLLGVDSTERQTGDGVVQIVLVSVLRDPATQEVVHFVDLLLSIVFLVDFLVRLNRAPSRRRRADRRSRAAVRAPARRREPHRERETRSAAAAA